jgi:hypothetical protein
MLMLSCSAPVADLLEITSASESAAVLTIALRKNPQISID